MLLAGCSLEQTLSMALHLVLHSLLGILAEASSSGDLHGLLQVLEFPLLLLFFGPFIGRIGSCGGARIVRFLEHLLHKELVGYAVDEELGPLGLHEVQDTRIAANDGYQSSLVDRHDRTLVLEASHRAASIVDVPFEQLLVAKGIAIAEDADLDLVHLCLL